MNPALFPIATAMSRLLAEDVGAPELQLPSAFALRPCRKAFRFSRLWRQLFAFRETLKGASTPAKLNSQSCSI